jgi:hypothetical protein
LTPYVPYLHDDGCGVADDQISELLVVTKTGF